jgi:hypothetical protein
MKEIQNKTEALKKYPLNASSKTIKKMDFYEKLGFGFIAGNNYRLSRAKKWEKYNCVRIAQTNSRHHGKSIATMWAVKES